MKFVIYNKKWRALHDVNLILVLLTSTNTADHKRDSHNTIEAHLQCVPWVLEALAALRPARAIVELILARALADSARNRAVEIHVARIGGALAFYCPVVAVLVDIRALRSADAATRRAHLQHVVGRLLALALPGPATALINLILAHVRACPTGVGAQNFEALGVLTLALALAPPCRTGDVAVVAEANRGSNGCEGRDENRESAHRPRWRTCLRQTRFGGRARYSAPRRRTRYCLRPSMPGSTYYLYLLMIVHVH
eukprot:6213673-Pleurochrysis_carterae.AAC.4